MSDLEPMPQRQPQPPALPAMEQPNQPAAPAGWYPDNTGQLRWWDGSQWGFYAPAHAPSYQAAPSSAVHVPSAVGYLPVAPVVLVRATKTVGTAVVLLLFLGGFGAHHFYLRQYPQAVIMIAAWWLGWMTSLLGIGLLLLLGVLIWWIVDLCTMRSQVDAANARPY
ncbi:NINE protein [Glaciibacter flavus]|uniref:NINE protein n=1 Tax=Orlajensenia flava TaxID=2565934 RepID=UPI00145534E9|nr:NINE protein [Glaciibacter flavus]